MSGLGRIMRSRNCHEVATPTSMLGNGCHGFSPCVGNSFGDLFCSRGLGCAASPPCGELTLILLSWERYKSCSPHKPARCLVTPAPKPAPVALWCLPCPQYSGLLAGFAENLPLLVVTCCGEHFWSRGLGTAGAGESISCCPVSHVLVIKQKSSARVG